jgi:vacuolar-type H+-ATPase subunit I/STV1
MHAAVMSAILENKIDRSIKICRPAPYALHAGKKSMGLIRRSAMKQTRFIIMILLFTALGPFSSFADEKDKTATAPAVSQQREQYEKTMEERLAKLGKQLDDLKAKAATMTEGARKEIKKQLAEAEKQRKTASRKLEALRKKSVAQWKKYSTEMDEAWGEFEKAYEKAKSHFKE